MAFFRKDRTQYQPLPKKIKTAGISESSIKLKYMFLNENIWKESWSHKLLVTRVRSLQNYFPTFRDVSITREVVTFLIYDQTLNEWSPYLIPSKQDHKTKLWALLKNICLFLFYTELRSSFEKLPWPCFPERTIKPFDERRNIYSVNVGSLPSLIMYMCWRLHVCITLCMRVGT